MTSDASFLRLRKQLVDAAAGRRRLPPEAGNLVLSWFLELHARRGHGLAGPCPITHQDIAAWAALRRIPIEPRHVELLCAVDDAWLRRVAFPDGGASRRTASQPITAEAFDAVFG
jgi:hypothetical protein